MTKQRALKTVVKGADNVLALVRTSGRCDAAEFLNKLALRHQARFRRYLEYLADGTPLKSPAHYRTLRKRDEDGVLVAELKVDKYRIYVVNYQRIWYLTHGQPKPKDNQVPAEIEKR